MKIIKMRKVILLTGIFIMAICFSSCHKDHCPGVGQKIEKKEINKA